MSEQNDFSYFYLQVTLRLPVKFQDNQPFISGEEVKNRFSRSQPRLISHQNNYSYFLSTNHPDASYQVSCQLGLSVQEKKLKIDFKHVGHAQSGHGGHLGFPI